MKMNMENGEETTMVLSTEQVDQIVEVTGQERGIVEKTLQACKGDVGLAVERLMPLMEKTRRKRGKSYKRGKGKVELYNATTNETIELFRSIAEAHDKTGVTTQAIKYSMESGENKIGWWVNEWGEKERTICWFRRPIGDDQSSSSSSSSTASSVAPPLSTDPSASALILSSQPKHSLDDGDDETTVTDGNENDDDDDDDGDDMCVVDETVMESAPFNGDPTVATISGQKRKDSPVLDNQCDEKIKKKRSSNTKVELYNPVTNETIEVFRSIAAASEKTRVGSSTTSDLPLSPSYDLP